MEVAIIDYKISNMFSVHSACSHFGLDAKITSDRDEILNARSAILPGVGTFGSAMEHLESMKLIPVIKDFIATGKPFMGICLGMQLLFSQSEEFGIHKGLDIISGTVKRFPERSTQGKKIKVPHIGWNKIRSTQNQGSHWASSPLKDISDEEFMYFVHSFYVLPEDPKITATLTDYADISFCSSLSYKNIFACQFHPEKSAKAGLKVLKNFSDSIKKDVLKVQI